MDKGFTALDVRGYLCTDCSNSCGRGKFFAEELKNAVKRNRYENLRCIECHDLLRCAACQKGFPKSYWSKKERENHTERKTDWCVRVAEPKGVLHGMSDCIHAQHATNRKARHCSATRQSTITLVTAVSPWFARVASRPARHAKRH